MHAGLRRLLEVERAGIFLDFDGTVSEIVPVASEARPVPGAPEVLEELAGALSLVALVSGRSAHELVRWFGPELEIWGVHGAQRAHEGSVRLAEPVAAYADLM